MNWQTNLISLINYIALSRDNLIHDSKGLTGNRTRHLTVAIKYHFAIVEPVRHTWGWKKLVFKENFQVSRFFRFQVLKVF